MYIRIHNGYEVKPHKEHPMSYIVVTAGKGGKIPNVLSGMYTSPAIAMSEIDKYLESKPVKEAKDAEAKYTG
jgi:NCAIR mutase (PurE)-related protein